MGVGKDRISELHESLLHNVLSFLPIKCVVATSILSKRWKDLWRSVPVLNVCEWQPSPGINDTRTIKTVQFQETNKLVRFLDGMVLPTPPLLPNDMPTVKKFRLDYCCCANLFNDKTVYDWISTLGMRKIEELSLCLRRDFSLPPSLFTCETLTALEIEMAGNLSSKNKKAGNLGFPPTVSFSRLKILHLTHIIFVDENLTTQLFSNTPVLEELMLNRCCTKGTNALCVSVASLKRLFITNHTTHSWNLRINFYSPNLQSLTYNGMPEDFVLTGHGFSSVVDADIDMAIKSVNNKTKRGKERLCGLKYLVEGILNVKLLTMSGDALGGFREVPVNRFRAIGNDVPECVLLQLKAIEFREIYGNRVELEVIEFFLKNSLVLQTMTIAFSSSLPQYRRDYVTRDILMYPKGAASSVINFL